MLFIILLSFTWGIFLGARSSSSHQIPNIQFKSNYSFIRVILVLQRGTWAVPDILSVDWIWAPDEALWITTLVLDAIHRWFLRVILQLIALNKRALVLIHLMAHVLTVSFLLLLLPRYTPARPYRSICTGDFDLGVLATTNVYLNFLREGLHFVGVVDAGELRVGHF